MMARTSRTRTGRSRALGALPRVTVRVATDPGAARTMVDLVGDDDPGARMPVPGAGAAVRLDVGSGMGPGDLARLAVVADRIRGAREVEIIGASPRVVEAARRALFGAWANPVFTAVARAVERGPGAPVDAWSALMLASVAAPAGDAP